MFRGLIENTSANSSTVELLEQYCTQTWYNASLGEGDSSFYKWITTQVKLKAPKFWNYNNDNFALEACLYRTASQVSDVAHGSLILY